MLYDNHHTIMGPSRLSLCGLKSVLEVNSLNVPIVHSDLIHTYVDVHITY